MKLSAVFVTLIGILMLGFGCQKIAAPRFTAPTDRDGAWRQDIEYLRDSFPKYCESLTDDSVVAFEGILNEIRRSIPLLSDNEIIVGILRAVATARDGHTRVNMKPSSQKLRRLPIRFYWFSEGLYVIKATREYAETLGARVLEINGRRPEELVDQMGDFISGNETSVRYSSSYFLGSPDFLNGIGVLADPDSVPLTFVREDGSVFTLTLPALPLGEKVLGYESWRELSPLSTESQDADDMEHLLNDVALPAYLSSPNVSCSSEYYEDRQILYIQINQNTNLNCKLKDFAKEVEEVFSRQSIESVIVDLRFNTGGNLLLTTDIVKGIPDWHTGSGKIYLVVGGPTFSAGIVTAARLKYYAGDRAVMVGEPAAEGLKFWAEARKFVLPNSKLMIMAPSAYHNWADRNYEKGKKHFWLMRFVGVPAEDIEVALPAVVTFGDYLRRPRYDRTKDI